VISLLRKSVFILVCSSKLKSTEKSLELSHFTVLDLHFNADIYVVKFVVFFSLSVNRVVLKFKGIIIKRQEC
jgi:hypothetical protein